MSRHTCPLNTCSVKCVILQEPDREVNGVTPALFKPAPDAEALSGCSPEDVGTLLSPQTCPITCATLQTTDHTEINMTLMLQTTDKKVNQVTPALFKLAPDAEALCRCSPEEVEAIIRTVGLAPTKSKSIVNTAKRLVELHGGSVPNTFEELEDLPGVGHKTASVVMAQCFGSVVLLTCACL
jgi:endonuclease III